MAEEEVTIPEGSGLAVGTKPMLYRDATGRLVAPAGLTLVSGAVDDRTFTPVGAANPVPVSLSGGATAANQATAIGHIDGIETLLGTANTALSAIQTAVQVLDNAISGNEQQVDLVSLPAAPVATSYLPVRLTDGAAFATPSSDATQGVAGVASGPQVMGEFDDTAPVTVAEGQAGKLRISANRNLYGTIRDAAGNERGVNVTGDNSLAIADMAHAAAGGTSGYSFLSTAAVQTAQVKGSPGRVFSLQFFNIHSAPVFVRLYNQTGAPAGGDNANIVWRGIVPNSTSGAGFTVHFPKGRQFTVGIGIRVTAAVADTDTGALTANVVAGNVDYV